MDCAICNCECDVWEGTEIGWGGATTGSGSSGSSDARHLRQRLLLVRNWTSVQLSHRTTSLESTGASVVAIRLWKMPERVSSASPQKAEPAAHNLRHEGLS